MSGFTDSCWDWSPSTSL